MMATLVSMGFTASANNPNDFRNEYNRVRNLSDNDNRSDRQYAPYLFIDIGAVAAPTLTQMADQIATHMDEYLRYNGKSFVVFIGYSDIARGDQSPASPNSFQERRTLWNDTTDTFEIDNITLAAPAALSRIQNIVVNPNQRHLSVATSTYRRSGLNGEVIYGYRLLFTPVRAPAVTNATSNFDLRINYRGIAAGSTLSFSSESASPEIRVIELGAEYDEFVDDRFVLSPGAATRDAVQIYQNRRVQIGDFDDDDFIQINIPRYARADVVDWAWNELVTEAGEIAELVGFNSPKAVAAFSFLANRGVVADNVTVSLQDSAFADASRTYNVYLVERGENITTTVAGVKVTAVTGSEGIRLGGDFGSTLTFPLINKTLGTYVITSAPLVNEDPNAIDEDLEDWEDDEFEIVDPNDMFEDAEPIQNPTTGSSDVVAMTILASVIALAAAGFVAVKRVQ
jgi:hypothetical protein